MSEEIEIDVDLTIRSSSGDDWDVQEITVGAAPLVYIVPEVVKESEMKITIDATDFNTAADLADFLVAVAAVVRQSPVDE